MAYTLYKSAKRQWLSEFEIENGRKPLEKDLAAYHKAQTDLVLNSHRSTADAIITSYAAQIKNGARPQFLEEALKGSFWQSFWPSFWASFAFTAVLLAVVVIAALLGFGFPVQISLPIKPTP